MSVTIARFTKFYIGPQKTAVTLADYEASGNVWTEVGGVQDVGEIGDETTQVKVLTMADARERSYRGVRQAGDLTLTVALDSADAGQKGMKDAFSAASQTDFLFKVVLPDMPAGGTSGTLLFFSGAVLSAQRKIGGPNDPIQSIFKMGVNSDVLEVPAA